jgi:hypothetical protein
VEGDEEKLQTVCQTGFNLPDEVRNSETELLPEEELGGPM